MKKTYLAVLTVFLHTLLVAQSCNPNTWNCALSSATNYPTGTFTLTTSWQTVSSYMNGGNYTEFNVSCGNTYQWTYCNLYGGYENFDPELTLFDQSGNFLCYQDNSNIGSCPYAPYLSWTATYTGIVYLLTTDIGTAHCQGNSGSTYWSQLVSRISSTGTCCSTPSAPSASATSSTICNGQTSTITASGGCNSCQYNWSTPQGNFSNQSQITASTSGTYTVSAYDPNCGLTSSGYSVTISQGSAPSSAQVSPASPKICGTTPASVSVSASNCNSCTYSWSGGSAPNSASNSFSTIGQYTVTITNNCGSITTSTTIANTPAPATPSLQATSSTIGCNGSTQVNITNTSAYSSCSGCSYIWSTPSGPVTNSSSSAYTASATGSYSLVVKDNCNQQSGTSNSINITSNVSVPILPTYTPLNPNTCGTPITLSVDPTYQSNCSGCTYQWTTTGGTQTSSSITISSAQTITLKATNCNGQSSPVATIQVTSTASASISPASPSACVGDSVLITASQGSGWSWNSGAITQSIYGKAGQTYNVVVTAPGGCSGSASASASIVSNPLPIVSAGNDTSVGSGQVVLLHSTARGGTPPYVSYQWDGGANPSSQNTTAILINPQDFCVTVTDSKGCQGSDCFHADTSSCGGSLSLNKASSQFGYSGGVDTILITAQSGCVWSASSLYPAMTNIIHSSGNGNGYVKYAISTCPNNLDRHDTISVSGIPFYITQQCSCNLSDTPTYSRNPVTGYITVTNYPNATYSWSYYGTPLPSDTLRFFNPTQPGTYTLQVSSRGNPSCLISVDIEITWVVGINEVRIFDAIDIYPNPSRSDVMIEGKVSNVKQVNIAFINTLGQEVYQKTEIVTSSQLKSHIDLSGLPAGIYLVTLQVSSGKETRRLVIER